MKIQPIPHGQVEQPERNSLRRASSWDGPEFCPSLPHVLRRGLWQVRLEKYHELKRLSFDARE